MSTSQSFKELIVSADGHEKAWAHDGERWIVVVQDDEHTPAFRFAIATEAECKRICRVCQDAHHKDESVFIVSIYMAAKPAVKVRHSRHYGVNGRVGRAKTMASYKRQVTETLVAEGRTLPERASLRALLAMREDAFAETRMWDRLEALLDTTTETAS